MGFCFSGVLLAKAWWGVGVREVKEVAPFVSANS
jgi:hypothetical protein